MKKSIWETLSERGFDVSDTPQEPTPPKKKGPPTAVPVRRDPKLASKGHAYNPGMPPERRKDEAVPSARTSAANVAQSRSRTPTMPMIPTTPAKVAEPPVPAGGPKTWEVENTRGEVFRVQADTSQEAHQLMMDFMADEMARQGKKAQIHPGEFKVRPAQVAGESVHETTTGANGAGFTLPMGDAEEAARKVYFKEALHEVMKEIIRKKKDGSGYALYSPNRGKKKPPKKVGEFPTRTAAASAELSRFPPKDPEAAKRKRAKLDKLKKDPKKRIAKDKAELSKKPGKRSGKPARSRKSVKESFVESMVSDLTEALFREDDIPGSPWDERLAVLSPNAMASDKKLASLTQAIQKASVASLMDAQKELARSLKKHAKCVSGEIGTETGGKTYIPIHVQRKGEEFGPIYLYVDRGQVRLEYSDEMQESLDGLDDDFGDRLRGMIMKFQEKHLPKIDGASKAIKARDQYLDKLDGKLDGQLSGFSGVELQMIKQLINQKHGRRFR